MLYSEYGKTGAKVSAVGFDGMRFDTSKSNEENAQLLLYAQSKGINFFDTAPGYCDDMSEDIFSTALKQMSESRSSYYVSTKGMSVAFDSADKAKEAIGACTECAACEQACTQHLNIIERLKEIDIWEKILNKQLTGRLEVWMRKFLASQPDLINFIKRTIRKLKSLFKSQ